MSTGMLLFGIYPAEVRHLLHIILVDNVVI